MVVAGVALGAIGGAGVAIGGIAGLAAGMPAGVFAGAVWIGAGRSKAMSSDMVTNL
jgi:hypothetical protein